MKLYIMLLLLLIPSALAFNCDLFDGAEAAICEEVNNASLGDDADLIMSNLFYSGNYVPDHDSVYEWNTGIEVNDAPDGVSERDGRFIRDAWLVFLAVMPSVIEDDSLCVPGNVSVLSEYDYGVEIPMDYRAGHYPETDLGDCRREYKLVSKDAENRFLVDNAPAGEGKLDALSIDSDSEIVSELEVKASMDIKHYNWHNYCCAWRMGDCVRVCHDCRYSSTERSTDRLVLTDSKEIKYMEESIEANLSVVNKYNGNTKLSLDFNDSVYLSFDDSSYASYSKYYDLVYSYEPYYIQTLRARNVSEERVSNLYRQDDGIVVKKADGCSLKAWNHFSTETIDCDLSFEDPELMVETDRIKYAVNETISVRLYPADTWINVSYGNTSVLAQNNAEFISDKSYNRITAKYKGIEAEKIVFVSDGDKMDVVFGFSVFSAVNYFIYGILRKYWPF